jgi:hypothetical protein
MALQSSGAISISQIKTELGSSSNSLRDLSAAAGKSTPDAMSEFYGYSAYTKPYVVNANTNSISGAGTQANPYVITKTSNFQHEEFPEYVDECDYGGIAYQWWWRQVEGIRPQFAWGQSGSQRVHWSISTINANTRSDCATSYTYFGLSVGSGSGTDYANSLLYGGDSRPNVVGGGGIFTTSPSTASPGQVFSPGYFLIRQAYNIDEDSWCEYRDGVSFTSSQPAYQCQYDVTVSNLTYTMWFEPV